MGVYVWVCVCMYGCVCMGVYVCMGVCVYVCVCIKRNVGKSISSSNKECHNLPPPPSPGNDSIDLHTFFY